MFLEYSADICTRENLTFDEHLENVFSRMFCECSYNIQWMFMRTFRKHLMLSTS